MIIVRLKGGMGNQMFQYALGRRLSEDWKMPFKLDTTGFENQPEVETKRCYDLNHFKIIEKFATKEEINKVKYPAGVVSKFWQKIEAKILRQYYIGFEPNILLPQNNIYLDGFWHSERYFDTIREILIKEFALKTPLSAMSIVVAPEIKNSSISTVALHIRRGDYANDPATLAHHGLVTLDYYQEAMTIMRKKLKLMKVFIFSDDIEWARENLKMEDAHMFVSRPPELPYFEEPFLMSLCQHNIIANSSFSWWGAWLNENPDKIVIAPKKWLANGDPYDEIPESWLKI